MLRQRAAVSGVTASHICGNFGWLCENAVLGSAYRTGTNRESLKLQGVVFCGKQAMTALAAATTGG